MGQLSPISDKLFTTIFGVTSALGALAGEEEFPPARPGEGKGEPARRSSDHVRSHVRLKSATAPSAAGNDLAAAASSTGLILRKALLRCEEILAMASEALSTRRGDNSPYGDIATAASVVPRASELGCGQERSHMVLHG